MSSSSVRAANGREELETMNEELQSTNDELQSSNDELRKSMVVIDPDRTY
jgi:hypothetical protein